jgi:MoaA/NifB/PqqE/SkfB family radical SAM enzyme
MEMLTVADMKKYIKDAIEAYDSIKVLVLTGGECLVYGRRLETIIRYATDLGLSVRVVTNGFWAKTYDKAYRKVEQLVAAGLKEINFSQYRR